MSTRLVDLIQLRIDDFIAEQKTGLIAIAPELAEVTDLAHDFLSGGKRFRGLFCYWGWNAVAGTADEIDPLPVEEPSSELPGVVLAAAALEMFHAAALVHDDIMDNSDTRRGSPAAHRRFEALHSARGWSGSPQAYGSSAALLLGDLLLGWSDELFDRATDWVADAAAGLAARAEFSRMRTEVTVGQYLDILEENAWTTYPEATALSRAHRVIVHKSARYSVEEPLAIGATLGSGSLVQVAALRAFGLPLGVAYQLRDDLLGVFGDPEVTGKPAGDDLTEGKRTVLIALARPKLPTGARNLVDELLGDPTLDRQQIDIIRTAIRDCGAVDEIEGIIEHNVQLATAAIEDAPIAESAKRELLQLAESATRRSA